MGPDVKDFKVGDRVAADNSELCGHCFYCRRGESLFCENWTGHGINLSGGFAQYCAYPQGKVFKIHNLTDTEATLIEPASCACHGLDKIRPRLGSSALMFGAGPTGLVTTPLLLSQLSSSANITTDASPTPQAEWLLPSDHCSSCRPEDGSR